ncbi:MAG: hypothetical protein VB948_05800 [Pseudomonadales bacterium]
MRRLATATVFILLGLAQSTLAQEAGNVLRVGEGQRLCASSRQCVAVYTQCGNCGCGVSVNESYLAAHNANLESLCAGHEPVQCARTCAAAKPMCVTGLCIMMPSLSL